MIGECEIYTAIYHSCRFEKRLNAAACGQIIQSYCRRRDLRWRLRYDLPPRSFLRCESEFARSTSEARLLHHGVATKLVICRIALKFTLS